MAYWSKTVKCSYNSFFFFQIEELDLLPQFLYNDYRWLIDFSFCAAVINVLVEIFAFFLPEIYTQELNLGLVWNFLVIFFALYPSLNYKDIFIYNESSGSGGNLGARDFFFKFALIRDFGVFRTCCDSVIFFSA